MVDQLTRDPAYDTVEPDDFASMIQTQRYGRRSPAFDKIIEWARAFDMVPVRAFMAEQDAT